MKIAISLAFFSVISAILYAAYEQKKTINIANNLSEELLMCNYIEDTTENINE